MITQHTSLSPCANLSTSTPRTPNHVRWRTLFRQIFGQLLAEAGVLQVPKVRRFTRGHDY